MIHSIFTLLAFVPVYSPVFYQNSNSSASGKAYVAMWILCNIIAVCTYLVRFFRYKYTKLKIQKISDQNERFRAEYLFQELYGSVKCYVFDLRGDTAYMYWISGAAILTDIFAALVLGGIFIESLL